MPGDAVAARTAPHSASTAVTGEVLRYLGLDPTKIEAHALVLLCDRYQLDPLLGHVAVIGTPTGKRVYVTRDGLLAVAHRSGRLDGIVVEEERRNSSDDGWTARVSVYVKGHGHPYTYGAQCKDTDPQAKAGNGPEMALARAERRALRRAFAVPAGDLTAVGDGDATDLDAVADDVYDVGLPSELGPPERVFSQAEAHAAVGRLPAVERAAFLERHFIEDFGSVWPTVAVLDAMGAGE